MKVKVLARIVIGYLILLVFSGCSSKASFYSESCPLEEPKRTPIVVICGTLDTYEDKMFCLINKYNVLENDYILKESFIQECNR